MNKVKFLIFSRSLALFLSLCLSLPNPAFGLRTQAGLENDTRAQLENELKDEDNQTRLAQRSIPVPAQSPPTLPLAAGLEGVDVLEALGRLTQEFPMLSETAAEDPLRLWHLIESTRDTLSASESLTDQDADRFSLAVGGLLLEWERLQQIVIYDVGVMRADLAGNIPLDSPHYVRDTLKVLPEELQEFVDQITKVAAKFRPYAERLLQRIDRKNNMPALIEMVDTLGKARTLFEMRYFYGERINLDLAFPDGSKPKNPNDVFFDPADAHFDHPVLSIAFNSDTKQLSLVIPKPSAAGLEGKGIITRRNLLIAGGAAVVGATAATLRIVGVQKLSAPTPAEPEPGLPQKAPEIAPGDETLEAELVRIDQLTHINGVPIDVIEQRARPREYAGSGFLGPDESLKDVIKQDLRTLHRLGRTKEELAQHLKDIARRTFQEQRLQGPGRPDSHIVKFEYLGQPLESSYLTSGYQKSILKNDDPADDTTNPDERGWGGSFLIKNLSNGLHVQVGGDLSDIVIERGMFAPGFETAERNIGYGVIGYIERHGFFEGGGRLNPWRVDPMVLDAILTGKPATEELKQRESELEKAGLEGQRITSKTRILTDGLIVQGSLKEPFAVYIVNDDNGASIDVGHLMTRIPVPAPLSRTKLVRADIQEQEDWRYVEPDVVGSTMIRLMQETGLANISLNDWRLQLLLQLQLRSGTVKLREAQIFEEPFKSGLFRPTGPGGDPFLKAELMDALGVPRNVVIGELLHALHPELQPQPSELRERNLDWAGVIDQLRQRSPARVDLYEGGTISGQVPASRGSLTGDLDSMVSGFNSFWKRWYEANKTEEGVPFSFQVRFEDLLEGKLLAKVILYPSYSAPQEPAQSGLETGVTRRQFLGAAAGAVATGPAAAVELFDGLTIAGTSQIIPDEDIRRSNPGIGDLQTIKVTLESAVLPQAGWIILQKGVKRFEIPVSWQRFIDEENRMPEALKEASQFMKDQVSPGDLAVVRDLANEAAQRQWNQLFRESGILGVVPAVLQKLAFDPKVLSREDAVAALLAALSAAHQEFKGGLILGATIQREGDRLQVYLYA